MRWTPYVGAFSLLAFMAVVPLHAHADIIQSVSDTETSDALTADSGWTQTLGTGISGTLTEASFVIHWESPLGFGDRMGIDIFSCTDDTYSSCSGISSYNFTFVGSNGINTIRFNSSTMGSAFAHVFDPTRYYRIRLYRIFGPGFNSDRTFRPLGSAADTYSGGSTDATGLSDLTFSLVGLSLPAVAAESNGQRTQLPNILFIPGIEGSRLYDETGNELWVPSVFGNDIEKLYMTASGTSIRSDIYTRDSDIIKSVPGVGDVYGELLGDFENLRTNGRIRAWKAIAYDWRLPVDDILLGGNQIGDRIYYAGEKGEADSPYIVQELERLAANGGKVTIIAHSNGGLIAKRLTQLLGPLTAGRLIDKIILVAAPQAGTPQAIASAMHGEDQDIAFGTVLNKREARTFASTTQMTYNLMPSEEYFTQIDDPVVTFDPSLTEWIDRYGDTIHSKERLDVFLKDSYGRADAFRGDITRPIQLDSSGELIAGAHALHERLDSWTPPQGIEVFQVAGWGIETIGSVKYVPAGSEVKPVFDEMVDGDGTVVVPSALWTNGPRVHNYWLDLYEVNRDNRIGFLGSKYMARKHATIFSPRQSRKFVTDIASNDLQPLYTYEYLSTAAPESKERRLHFTLRSPLTLNLYDDQGRHTGVLDTGEIEEGIPGAYYSQLGDTKFIAMDENTPVKIVLDGYDTGSFTFIAEEVLNNNVIASTTFKDIPVTPQTKASLTLGDSLKDLSAMELDRDGDGITDEIVDPQRTSQELQREYRDENYQKLIPYIVTPEGKVVLIY